LYPFIHPFIHFILSPFSHPIYLFDIYHD
jgi:hypothetical protein